MRCGWATDVTWTLYAYERIVVEMDTRARNDVIFGVHGTSVAAWHYPSRNGACAVMAGGLGVPRGPGTDRFAARFVDAGFGVVAFDYRCLGDSGGTPRDVVRLGDPLDDWDAAIDFAAALPDVDPSRVAIWGFSVSGGHVVRVASRNRRVAAAIAQTPLVNGPAAARHATRHQHPGAAARATGRAVADSVLGWFGRPPLLVPLIGEPGTVALLTTPDALDGPVALDAVAYPEWQQQIAARSILQSRYKPARAARHVRAPLLVVVADDDQSALAAPAVRMAARVPRAEVVHIPGGHYAPFQDAHEMTVNADVTFLHQHLAEA
jgi:uncharacterized protein